jgi:ribokinase
MVHVPAFPVTVVDTTAAGDALNGALAVALAEGRPLSGAVRFANAAAGLACTQPGAQNALPVRTQVDALLANVRA